MNSDEIRRLVREAIAEALGPKEVSPATPAAVSVSLANDADLNAFARKIAGDPKLAKSIAEGRTSFSLSQTQTQSSGGGDYRWPGGLLNETRIVEISKTHSRVLLPRGTVVTPLARDKARDVKLELVKERS